MDFTNENNTIVFTESKFNNCEKIKLAAFDLDHTLIKPKGSRVHPKSIDDYELVFKNLEEKMIDLNKKKYNIVIFSNQDNLNSESKIIKKNIVLTRINKLYNEIFQKNNIPLQVYISTLRDHCRKPNIGLFMLFLQKNNCSVNFDESFYVGDAAGRIECENFKKDFSCSDRKFAHNCGLKFMTPETFFENNDNRKYMMNAKYDLFPDCNKKFDELYNILPNYNIVFIFGCVASGKSTLAADLLKRFNFDIIVNHDTLGSKKKSLKILDESISSSKKIIVENLFATYKSRKDYLDIIRKNNSSEKILGIHLDISKEQALFLNNFRSKLEKKEAVKEVVIHTYFKYFDDIKLIEGFDKIINIPFVKKFKNNQNKDLFHQYY